MDSLVQKNNAKKRIFFKEMDKTRQLLALVPSAQSHRLCSQINFHTFKHSKLDKLKSFCHAVCQETYNWQRTFLVFVVQLVLHICLATFQSVRNERRKPPPQRWFDAVWEFEWENKVAVDNPGSRVGQMFCKNIRYSTSSLLLFDID